MASTINVFQATSTGMTNNFTISLTLSVPSTSLPQVVSSISGTIIYNDGALSGTSTQSLTLGAVNFYNSNDNVLNSLSFPFFTSNGICIQDSTNSITYNFYNSGSGDSVITAYSGGSSSTLVGEILTPSFNLSIYPARSKLSASNIQNVLNSGPTGDILSAYGNVIYFTTTADFSHVTISYMPGNTNTISTGYTGNGITASSLNNSCFGISRDGSTLYYFQSALTSGITILSVISTSAWTNNNYTSSAAPVTTNVKLIGKIVQDSNGYLYVSAYTTIFQVKNITSSFAFNSCVTTTSMVCNGLDIYSRDGIEYIIFPYNNGSINTFGYFVAQNITSPSSVTRTIDNLVTTSGTVTNFTIDQYTGTIFFVKSNSPLTVSCYSIGVDGNRIYLSPLLSSSYNVTGVSLVGGLVSNSYNNGGIYSNTRLFFYYFGSNGNYNLYKIYNSTSDNGGIGTSVGGDPHIKDISGREKIITPEDKFLLLDTLPCMREYLHPQRIYIYCDSFNIGNHPELVSDYQYTNVDNKESFLKTLFVVCGNMRVDIDMVSLEIKKTEIFDTSVNSEWFSGSEKIEMNISDKIDCSLLEGKEYPLIRNEKYRKDLIFFRKILISNFDDEDPNCTIEIELIRTKCINYSDINITFSSGNVNGYTGALINCEEIEYPNELY